MKYVPQISTYLLVILFASIYQIAPAQIIINEFSASNKSDFPDNFQDYEDWIELLNTTNSSINLAGYYLSDKIDNPTKWQFPSGVTLAANQRLVVFASSNDYVNGSYVHTNFKLTQNKQEHIVLSNPDGELLDVIQLLNPTQGNHSRGRIPDGGEVWAVFDNPTPRFSNANSSFIEYTTKPIFNQPSGFYTSNQTIEIFANADATIHYTLDGTTPTSNSLVYNSPITISETTVVRAKAFSSNDDLGDSFVETNTYFINETTHLPVLSLADDEYESVLFGQKNEIMTSLEFFDENKNFQFEMDGDMRGHGNDSWFFDQKGMRFYTRDQYGSANNIEYPLIPSTPRDEYDVIIIRALGSDNYPGQGWRPSTHVRDPFLQSLADDNDMHLDVRRHSPVVVFINGEYWGLYSFRERIDSDFTKFYHDQKESNVDMLEYWGGLDVRYGNASAWYDLYDYMLTNDLSVQSNYDYVDERMDVLSVIDYSILNTFVVNTDWLNWNTKWWRGTDGDGTGWRYCLWDMDNTFNLGENYTGLPTTTYESDPCDVNNIYDDAGPSIGHVDMLLALMENEDFKKTYFERYAELMNTVFTCDNLINHLDSMLQMIEPEMPRQIQRWGGTMNEWQSNVDRLKNEILGKCTIVGDQLVDCYEDEGFEGPYTIYINVEPEGAGVVVMNEIVAPSYPWEVTYFGGLEVNLSTYPDGNFTFSHWEVNNNLFSPDEFSSEINLTLNASDQITAVFSEENPCEGVNVNPTIEGNMTICEGSSTTLTVHENYSNYLWSTEGQSNQIEVTEAGVYTVIVTNDLGCTGEANFEVSTTDIVSPNIIGNSVLCPDGRIYLRIEEDYESILWSNEMEGDLIEITETGIYEVTVTNDLGCTSSSSIEIVESVPFEFTIEGDNNICEGVTTQFTCMTISPGTFLTSYTWSTGETTQSIDIYAGTTFGFVETFSVTVTDQNGCSASEYIELIINETPELNISGSLSICDGQATTLQVTPDYPNYEWSVPNTGNEITLSEAGTYEVTVTNQFGCTNSSSFEIIASDQLDVAILGNTSACQGDSINLTLAGDFENYTWSTESQNSSIEVAETGTYTVTVSNASGCTGIASQEISFFENPTVELVGATEFCEGGSSTLSANIYYENSTSSPIITDYVWNTGENNSIITILEPYTYCLSVSDSNGCTAASEVEVATFENPEPEIIGSTIFCADANTTLSVDDGYENYFWSNQSTENTTEITESGLYSVTVVDENFCVGTQSVEVTVNEVPEFSIQGATSFCEGSTSTLSIQEEFTSYTWSNESTENNIEIENAGTYTVTVTNANDCSAIQSIEVSQSDALEFSIQGATSFCEGSTSQLSVPDNFQSYLWSNQMTTPNIEIAEAGSYEVTITDSNSCTGSQNIEVIYKEDIQFEVSGNTSFCNGSVTTLNAPTGFSAYQWSNSSQDASVEISEAGNYIVTVTDADGCTGEQSVLVTENESLQFTIEGENNICAGASTVLAVPEGYSYQWSNNAQTETIAINETGFYSVTITDIEGCTGEANTEVSNYDLPVFSITGEPQICSNSTSNLSVIENFESYLWSTGDTTQIIEISASNNYQVTVTDSNGCSNTNAFFVEEYVVPLAAVNAPSAFCEGTSVEVSAAGVFESYLWSNGSTESSTILSESGTYTLLVTDENACTSENSFTLEYFDNPNPIIEGDLSICEGGSTQLQTTQTYQNYQWSNGQITPQIEISETGNYTLTVFDENACSASIDFEVSSIFTPSSTEVVQLCYGDSYNGTSYFQNTSFEQFFESNFGCDSLHTIFIEVSPEINLDLAGTDNCDGTGTIISQTNIIGNTSYLWSDNSTNAYLENVQTGTYNLTITDEQGCTQTNSIELVLENALNLEIEILQPNCAENGVGTVYLEPNGGLPPYTATWSNGNQGLIQENLPVGNYTILINDANACQIATSVQIQAPAALQNSFINEDTQDGILTTAFVNGGTPPYQYTWSNGGTSQSILELEATTFYLTITDANGCILETSINTSTTSNQEVQQSFDWEVFPNPTSGNLSLRVQKTTQTLLNFKVYNVLGKELLQGKLSASTKVHHLNLSKLTEGVYFIQLSDSTTSQTKKIVKQ